ncbi:MAG: biotin--[acetyl-CoA-carboxylase] ligase [Rikenellaceae bacterium]
MKLHIFEETTSTNDLAKGAEYGHGDAIWAHHQSAGRGQRGNKWSGGVGENIAFSVVFEPIALAASDQFVISQIAALALHDTMAEYGVETRIKWTNDIYVGDKKLAGILIENSLCDGVVTRSVVGIGLNINQLQFDPSLPNPTSMAIVTSKSFDREEVLRRIHQKLMERIESIDAEGVAESYRAHLYRIGERHTYRRPSGELFEATIEGVAQRGELLLREECGALNGYLFREVEFVIEGREG